jgi:parallel beta-helix repeat protein
MSLKSIFWGLLFAGAFIVAEQVYASTLYISADGNDMWSGRLSKPNTEKTDGPLASLAGARDSIRQIKSHTPIAEPLRVVILEGTYTLTEPFVLTPEDSGTKECPIYYEAQAGTKPIFTGGRVLSGFRQSDSGLWETHIPEATAGKWHFEQLFVNGRRAVRAREPHKSFFRMGATSEVPLEQGKDVYQRTTSVQSDAIEVLKKISDQDLGDVTLVAYHKWCISRRFLNSIDPGANSIITVGEKLKDYSGWDPDTRFHLENFKAALDSPGEWFLSRNGTLYYMPMPGEDISTAVVVAPVIEKFVVFDGKPEEKKFVEHVHLKGLTFSYNQTTLPRTGYPPYQAAFPIEAAIMANGAYCITIEDCEISHTGTYGIWFRHGCRDCRIERCYLYDLGAGGIRIGEERIRPDEPSRTSHLSVDNTIIRSGGRIYTDAVGVWIGHSGDNTITHNDIGDLFYTGISVGWQWGYAESLAKRNNISFNHVHHIGWGVLCDMGGIYMLGPSEGTVVRNNVFHDISCYNYGGWGIYTDEGSTGVIIENNLVYNTTTGGFHQHYGKENIIRNNIFAFSKQHQLQASRVEDHLSFIFQKNIVYWKTGPLLAGSWDRVKINMDTNCYWNAKDQNVDFVGMSLQQWQEKGHDVHSIVADPLFIDADNLDFQLKPDSPAFKIGFKPFDYSKAGVYGSTAWIDKARQAILPPLEIASDLP